MRSTTRLLIFVAGFCACFMAVWLSSDFTAQLAPVSMELTRDEATTDTERQVVEGIPEPATIQTEETPIREAAYARPATTSSVPMR